MKGNESERMKSRHLEERLLEDRVSQRKEGSSLRNKTHSERSWWGTVVQCQLSGQSSSKTLGFEGLTLR
jgi:hypothetical protein